jgi:Domain of unknown function (DUF4258)
MRGMRGLEHTGISVATVVFHDEARRLRTLANKDGVAVAFSPHSEKEMRKDGITRVDILSILKRCTVIGCELCAIEWRWTARGGTCDGENVEIVCIPEEELIRIDVITVWRKG